MHSCTSALCHMSPIISLCLVTLHLQRLHFLLHHPSPLPTHASLLPFLPHPWRRRPAEEKTTTSLPPIGLSLAAVPHGTTFRLHSHLAFSSSPPSPFSPAPSTKKASQRLPATPSPRGGRGACKCAAAQITTMVRSAESGKDRLFCERPSSPKSNIVSMASSCLV